MSNPPNQPITSTDTREQITQKQQQQQQKQMITLTTAAKNFPLLRSSKTKQNNIKPIEVMINNLDQSIKNKTGNGFSEFDVFSKEDSEFNQKRLVLSQLYNELIEDLINILDSKLNNAISLEDKKRYFLLFVWKLKKTLLIINSVNILKVKNNLF